MPGAIQEILVNWRRKYEPILAGHVITIVRQQKAAEYQNPEEFAKHLLMIYKVGSAISANDEGRIPLAIRNRFSSHDAIKIRDSNKKLLKRLKLCTVDDHDFETDEQQKIELVLDQFKEFCDKKCLLRAPLNQIALITIKLKSRKPLSFYRSQQFEEKFKKTDTGKLFKRRF